MSAEMTADNPYSAPDADLDHGQSELYSPSIISFNGRIGRLRYLAYSTGTSMLLMPVMIPLVGASAFMGAGMGEEAAMSTVGMLAMAVFYIAALVLTVMFGKRRLNDLNRSGWWIALFIVPIANLLLTIYLIFFAGTDGDNGFGAEPEANSTGVKILGLMMPAMFILGILAAVIIPALA